MKRDVPVHLFATLPGDEILDSIKPARAAVDESLMDDPLVFQEFADTVVNSDAVVKSDGVDVLTNKKIKKDV